MAKTKQTNSSSIVIGRPCEFSQDLATLICSLVANGSNLSQICASDSMPSRDTVYRWFRSFPSFSDDYARARDDRGDIRNDKIDEIRDRMLAGQIDFNTARVAIDTLKWQAGKESPKRYGERLELAGDKEAPLMITVRRLDK
jgi:hypothetical protein